MRKILKIEDYVFEKENENINKKAEEILNKEDNNHNNANINNKKSILNEDKKIEKSSSVNNNSSVNDILMKLEDNKNLNKSSFITDIKLVSNSNNKNSENKNENEKIIENKIEKIENKGKINFSDLIKEKEKKDKILLDSINIKNNIKDDNNINNATINTLRLESIDEKNNENVKKNIKNKVKSHKVKKTRNKHNLVNNKENIDTLNQNDSKTKINNDLKNLKPEQTKEIIETILDEKNYDSEEKFKNENETDIVKRSLFECLEEIKKIKVREQNKILADKFNKKLNKHLNEQTRFLKDIKSFSNLNEITEIDSIKSENSKKIKKIEKNEIIDDLLQNYKPVNKRLKRSVQFDEKDVEILNNSLKNDEIDKKKLVKSSSSINLSKFDICKKEDLIKNKILLNSKIKLGLIQIDTHSNLLKDYMIFNNNKTSEYLNKYKENDTELVSKKTIIIPKYDMERDYLKYKPLEKSAKTDIFRKFSSESIQKYSKYLAKSFNYDLFYIIPEGTDIEKEIIKNKKKSLFQTNRVEEEDKLKLKNISNKPDLEPPKLSRFCHEGIYFSKVLKNLDDDLLKFDKKLYKSNLEFIHDMTRNDLVSIGLDKAMSKNKELMEKIDEYTEKLNKKKGSSLKKKMPEKQRMNILKNDHVPFKEEIKEHKTILGIPVFKP